MNPFSQTWPTNCFHVLAGLSLLKCDSTDVDIDNHNSDSICEPGSKHFFFICAVIRESDNTVRPVKLFVLNVVLREIITVMLKEIC